MRERSEGTSRLAFKAAMLLGAVLAGAPLGAIGGGDDHPNQPRGIVPELPYAGSEGGGIDFVSPFGGSVSLAIPVGQRFHVNAGFGYGITVYYTSNIWTYAEGSGGGQPNYVIASIASDFNAGLGWTVGFGRLLAPLAPGNPMNAWIYVDQAGARHRFFQTLHSNDNESGQDPSGHFLYTRDNSVLRLNKSNASSPVVEFPDGTRHTFTNGLVTRIEDRVGNYPNNNYVNISYSASQWTLTDRHGRTQRIFFASQGGGSQHIDYIELAGYGQNSNKATYDFEYQNTTIRRTCQDTNWANNEEGSPNGEEALLSVPLLKSIIGPMEIVDPSKRIKWQIVDGGAADYHRGDLRANPGCHFAGVIESLRQPAMGMTTWTWQQWEFPPTGDAYRDSSPGVATRTVWNDHPFPNQHASWIYTPSLFPASTPSEVRTDIRDPDGNISRYYFHAPASDPLPWDYGLPITKTVESPAASGKYLSTQLFDSKGNLARQHFVKFTSDSLVGVAPADVLLSNRRSVFSRVQYRDDPGGGGWHKKELDLADFDGLGHYRSSSSSSTFPEGSTTRTERTQWNESRGCYSDCVAGGTGPWSPPLPSTPWVLQTLSFTRQNEGGDFAQQNYQFDSVTGFLQRIRIATAQNGNSGAHDVLMLFCPEAGTGNVASQRWFGGDLQDLNQANVTCATPSDSSLRLDFGYTYGTRSSELFVRPGGATLGFSNWTAPIVDRNSGAVKRHCDSAGYCSDLDYDRAGRLIQKIGEATEGAIRTADVNYSYNYNPASSEGWVMVATLACPSGIVCDTTAFPSQKVHYDGFGRVFKVQRENADTTWSKQVRRIDEQGRVHGISEWQSSLVGDGSVPTTYFQDFDAFGRPQHIAHVDGHESELSYSGDRVRKRRVQIATGTLSAPAETLEETTEVYDGLGRLVRVTQPSGPGGTAADTYYSYDIGNRLQTINQAGQIRTYLYDRRGFLQSETIPEKGLSGNGSVTLGGYTASGLPTWRRDVSASRGLVFGYEWGSPRLVSVHEELPGGGPGAILKSFGYDQGAGLGLGKLSSARGYNYLPELGKTIEVLDSFSYQGIAGAASAKATQFVVNGVGQEQFTTTLTRDHAGQIVSIGYPECSGGICGSPGSFGRTVEYEHQRGFLDEIPGFADSISYHANGLFSQVQHSNSMTETQGISLTTMIRRPLYLNVTSSAGELFLSGNYAYDGAGNIKALGPHKYRYDAVSRLTESQENWGGPPRTQNVAFDTFGNIQSISTDIGGLLDTNTSATTNRLVSGAAAYDEAGSLTQWIGAFYGYDRLNRLRRFQSGSETWYFAYGADDERVWSFRETGAGELWTLRGLDGKVLREYRAHSTVALGGDYKDYIWRDGALLAKVEPILSCVAPEPPGPPACSRTGDLTLHVAVDHLGTPRVVSSPNGSLLAGHIYYPYGQEVTGSYDGERLKYTGHERDVWNTEGTADDLDYMHARHYNPQLGRFLQVDPFRGWQRNPQSLNRYAYVTGNPLRYIDPFGLDKGGQTCVGGHEGLVCWDFPGRPDRPPKPQNPGTDEKPRDNPKGGGPGQGAGREGHLDPQLLARLFTLVSTLRMIDEEIRNGCYGSAMGYTFGVTGPVEILDSGKVNFASVGGSVQLFPRGVGVHLTYSDPATIDSSFKGGLGGNIGFVGSFGSGHFSGDGVNYNGGLGFLYGGLSGPKSSGSGGWYSLEFGVAPGFPVSFGASDQVTESRMYFGNPECE